MIALSQWYVCTWVNGSWLTHQALMFLAIAYLFSAGMVSLFVFSLIRLLVDCLRTIRRIW